MYAFDSTTGEEVARSQPGIQVGFSPQVAFNGNLVSGDDDNIVALRLDIDNQLLAPVPNWGELNWDFLLAPGLGNLGNGPEVQDLPPNITINNVPRVRFQGVVAQHPNTMLAPPNLTYEGSLDGASRFSSFKQVVNNIDPDTGLYIDGSFSLAHPDSGSWMSGMLVGRWGGVYDSFRAEGLSKLWLGTINQYLLENTPAGGSYYVQDFAPGGVFGMEPVSPLKHSREVISFMTTMVDKAIVQLDSGYFQLAFDVARRLPPNTTRQSSILIKQALDKGEIDAMLEIQVQALLVDANSEFEAARSSIIDLDDGSATAKLNKGKTFLNQILVLLP